MDKGDGDGNDVGGDGDDGDGDGDDDDGGANGVRPNSSRGIHQVTLTYDVVFNNVPENVKPSESYFASAGLSIFDQDGQVSLVAKLEPNVDIIVGFVFVDEVYRADNCF